MKYKIFTTVEAENPEKALQAVADKINSRKQDVAMEFVVEKLF